MEIEVEDRSKLVVEKGQKAVFGRGNGFNTTDPTVSRRHLLFELEHRNANQTEPTISFEVIGRNPIWVRSHKDREVRVFKKAEKGELAAGDWLCVSGKRPIWFKVRNVAEEEEDKRVLESETALAEGLINGSEWESVDVSGIDPVKEFGFIVMGHEFDQYPKMIRDVKNWDWFLEEPRKESDDDGYEGKGRRGGRRKRKKGEEDDNEEWTGDSEADEEFVAKLRKVNKPKYSTRSKAHNEPQKKAKGGKSSVQKMTSAADEEGIDDEDDETLGGFIVGEDGLEDEEDHEGTDEFEEEEFVEEEDDDDDDDDDE